MFRLLFRSLLERPVRTALFLVGYALGVAMVATLLSVGAAVLDQAQDKDLLGGGDVILLPVGTDVELLKVGGSANLAQSIPGLRFLMRNLLESPRLSGLLATASPRFSGKQLYLEHGGRITPVLAGATIPSRERGVLPRWAWADSFRDLEAERRLVEPTPHEALCDLDHFHVPPARARELRWAEWHYFEVYEPATSRFAYLSFQVFGDWRAGRARAAVSVQLGRPGEPVRRLLAPVDPSQVRASLERPDLELGASSVRLEGGRYHVRFRVPGAAGDLVFDPDLKQSFLAGEQRGDSGWVSGYAVPFLSGRVKGKIREGTSVWRLHAARAYHDHNWGGWRDVSWQWGKAAGDSLSFLYGQVTAPGQDQPGFAAVFSPQGLLAVFRPEQVQVHWGTRRVPVGFGEASLPDSVKLHATSGESDTLDARIAVLGATGTPLPGNREFTPAALRSATRAFLQMRGEYRLRVRLDGTNREAHLPGPLETFAPIQATRTPGSVP